MLLASQQINQVNPKCMHTFFCVSEENVARDQERCKSRFYPNVQGTNQQSCFLSLLHLY